MSLLQPVPQACDNECTETGTSSIPGPQGEPGTNGANGANGISAVTYVADHTPDPQPVMPLEGQLVTVNVKGDTATFGVDQYVNVEGWGTMRIDSLPTGFQMILENVEDTALGLYPDNAAPGTPLAEDNRIGPTGQQGANGAVAAGALLAANNLSDVADLATSQANLGLGTAALLDSGVGAGNLPQNDTPLVAGDAVFATATGLETKIAADSRAAFGLGDMALQDSTNVNIQGGLMNGTLGVTTPDTIVGDNVTVQGLLTAEANVQIDGKTFTPPSGVIQSLAAANDIVPSESVVRIQGAGGAVVLTSTPTIDGPPATDGQRLVLVGAHVANTVTLQDESNFVGTKLRLAGGNDVVLGLYDTLELLWDATTGFWLQTGASDN